MGLPDKSICKLKMATREKLLSAEGSCKPKVAKSQIWLLYKTKKNYIKHQKLQQAKSGFQPNMATSSKLIGRQ